MNEEDTPRSTAASIAFCATAALLCLCSIVQLELATIAVHHAMHLVAGSRADPPIVVRFLLPPWLTLSRTPWELVLCLAYAVLFVLGLRRNFKRFAVLTVLLWLACNTLFFVLLWLASLSYKTCCI